MGMDFILKDITEEKILKSFEILKKDPNFLEIVNKFKHQPDILQNLLNDSLETLIENSIPYKWEPVATRKFLEDPYYCGVNPLNDDGVCKDMYESLKEDFIKCHNIDFPFREAILSGSIGWGKSYWVALGLVWNLYFLSCLKNPHNYFSISTTSKIAVMIISITEKQAKNNMFSNVKEMIKKIPYFKENFYFDVKKQTDMLEFPNNIVVFNGTSSQSSTIGLNIYSAALDEANFFKVIEASKRSRDPSGEYDEALVLYYSLLRRQESRFLKQGLKPGLLYLASSNQYPDDFTAKRVSAAKEDAKSKSYIMDYARWDVCREKYSKEEFLVELGGINKKNRILEGNESDITGDIIKIPMDFYDSFKKDLDNAIRDIAGKSIYAVSPFFAQKEYIQLAIDSSLPKIFSVDKATLSPKREYLLAERILIHKISNPKQIRYVGLDIGLKKDRFGFAMGHISQVKVINREYFDELEQKTKVMKEMVPYIIIDMILEIIPEKEFGEVELSRVRTLILNLRRFGYKIKFVSADGFQSKDTEQILKRMGIAFEYISMDRTTEPYEAFRTALYDERIKTVYHEKYEEEMNKLEKDYIRNKVDHVVHGSKDLTDAVGQVIYNCHINMRYQDDSLLPMSLDSNLPIENVESYDSIIETFNKWSRS